MNRKLLSLQAGRGIAALLVVLYHASGTIFEDPRFWGRKVFGGFFGFGHAGVYFFFVLSGFIIISSHFKDTGEPRRALNYLARRFIRVYPPYWVVVAPLALLYSLRPEFSKPELTAPSVIMNSWALIGLSNHASLPVAWTLFHEILFYLLFCTLILNRWLGATVLVAWFVACLVVTLVFGESHFYPLSQINLLFAGGMAVFLLCRRIALHAPDVIVLIGAVAFAGTGMLEVYDGLHDSFQLDLGYGVGSTLVVAGLVALEQRRVVAVPSTLVLLGDASYSIYLTHYPILSIVARSWIRLFGTTAIPPFVAFATIILLCVIGGIAFHFAVEKPLTQTLAFEWRR